MSDDDYEGPSAKWKVKLKIGDYVWVIVSNIFSSHGWNVKKELKEYADQLVRVKLMGYQSEKCGECKRFLDDQLQKFYLWQTTGSYSRHGSYQARVQYPNGFIRDMEDDHMFATRSAAAKHLVDFAKKGAKYATNTVKMMERDLRQKKIEAKRAAERLVKITASSKAKRKPKKRKLRLKGSADGEDTEE